MDSGLRVLVVDDEVPLTGVIGSYLRAEGFEVSFAHNGPDAVALAREVDPVLIVLDVMLPGFDGIEACRQIRQFSDAYVVMLTAQEEEIDKVLGLSMGADDYIVKPFSPRELIARVQAMLRRPRASTAGPADAEPITIGGLTLDTVARIVTGRQLIEDVWGTTWFGDDHVVDVHIGHLRSKLGDDATNPRFVRTVRGVGYAMGTG